MENYVIDILKELRPEKIDVKKFRNENEFLIVREKTKKILILNRTAREIYNSCRGSTVDKIISIMCMKYPNISKEKISIDTVMCLRDLERRELIALR
ncbi:hypothetical protein A3K64_02190 [Candidatus Micrarchaeota archaeon RBG_16_36_9]|nr:MAG: hypothetical protein A3K64_02190 [Candidatus Micrarchaeota archaeon RBG_16_36_9]